MDKSLADTSSEGTVDKTREETVNKTSEGTVKVKSEEWVEKTDDWVGLENLEMGDEKQDDSVNDKSEDKQGNSGDGEAQQKVEMKDESFPEVKTDFESGNVEDGDTCKENKATVNNSSENIENAENIVDNVEEDEGDEQNKDKQVEEKFDTDVKIETDVKHPYKDLLDNYRVSEADLEPVGKNQCVPLKQAQHFFITTKASLMEIVEQLSSEEALGIVFRYNTQNYFSRLCVLQLSSGPLHYLIDCIKLEPHLHILSDLFGDPKIVKVVHGSQFMLTRFQLDHNLYFVNLFDTSIAMNMLGWKKQSYRQFMEDKYGVPKADKDVVKNLTKWHLRPLPEKYKDLLVIDGHFLIATYQFFKDKLIQKKLLERFLLTLNDRCKRIFKESNPLEEKFPHIPYLKPSQVHAIYALEEWRHALGRKKQKNVNLILDWRSFKLMIEKMPTKKFEILKICSSEIAANKVAEIQTIIVEASKVIGPINSKDGINIGIIEDTKPAGAARINHNKRPLNIKDEQPAKKQQTGIAGPFSIDEENAALPKADDKNKPPLNNKDIGTLKTGPTGNKTNRNQRRARKRQLQRQNQRINKAKNKFEPKMSAGKTLVIKNQVINNPGNKGPANRGPKNLLANQGPKSGPANQGPRNGAANQGPRSAPANQGPKSGPVNQRPKSGPANQGTRRGPANQGLRSGPVRKTADAEKVKRNNRNNKRNRLRLRDKNDRYRMTDSGRGMNVRSRPPIWDGAVSNLKNILNLSTNPELPLWNIPSYSKLNLYPTNLHNPFEANHYSDVGTSSRFERPRSISFIDIGASRTGHYESRSSNNRSIFEDVDVDFDVRRQNGHNQRNGNSRDNRDDVVSYPQYNPSRYNTQGYR